MNRKNTQEARERASLPRERVVDELPHDAGRAASCEPVAEHRACRLHRRGGRREEYEAEKEQGILCVLGPEQRRHNAPRVVMLGATGDEQSVDKRRDVGRREVEDPLGEKLCDLRDPKREDMRRGECSGDALSKATYGVSTVCAAELKVAAVVYQRLHGLNAVAVHDRKHEWRVSILNKQTVR
jgi:hypothetical protein